MTATYSVSDFCREHRISRGLFYNLLQEGKGPTIMKVGRRTLISEDACASETITERAAARMRAYGRANLHEPFEPCCARLCPLENAMDSATVERTNGVDYWIPALARGA